MTVHADSMGNWICDACGLHLGNSTGPFSHQCPAAVSTISPRPAACPDCAKLRAQLAEAQKRCKDFFNALENKIGDLVVVAHWPDFNPHDAMELGVLEDIVGAYYYLAGNARGWRYCRKVVALAQPAPNMILAGQMLTAALSTGHEGTVKLAAQLAGVPECDGCGYVKSKCRCAQPAPKEEKP